MYPSQKTLKEVGDELKGDLRLDEATSTEKQLADILFKVKDVYLRLIALNTLSRMKEKSRKVRFRQRRHTADDDVLFCRVLY